MNRYHSWVSTALLLIIGLFTCFPEPAYGAAWVSTGGPLGGLGYDVRIHPDSKDIMYVTDNYAGVIKSADAGRNWTPSNSGITVKGGPTGDAYSIFSLTIDPNDPDTLWAGTNGDSGAYGVFKSTDGGASWSIKNSGITTAGYGIVFRGFTIKPGDSNTVYAQAEVPSAVNGREFNRVQGRVYKTTNGGSSWSLLWEGDNLARYLLIDPTDADILYLSTGIFDREANGSNCASGLAGSGGVGVMKSTDGGGTWTAINSGLTDLYVGSLRMHPSNPQILFAATGNNACSGLYDEGTPVSGLFKTTNGGSSWTKVIGDEIMTTVNFSPSNPTIMYAGSASAFYSSADGGTTWTPHTKPTGEWGPVGVRAGVPIDITIDPDDPTLLYANNYGGGVFRSTDGAITWEIWSKGYSGADIHNAVIADSSPATVFVNGRSGPYKSENYGVDWTGIGTGAATFAEWYSVAVQPGNPDIVLVADEHQGFILRSSDGGNDFSPVLHHPNAEASNPTTREGFKTLVFAPSSPNIVYAGLAKDRGTIDTSTPVGHVLYKSTDGGAHFSAPTTELDGLNIYRLTVDSVNAATLWAATSGGVYTSIDGGSNWEQMDGLGDKVIMAVKVDPNDPTHLIASEKEVGIWTSTDEGDTWTGPHNTGLVNNANPTITALAFDPAASGTVYAADYYSGVYRSTDGGSTWSQFPDNGMSGLTVKAVKDLAFADDVLYAATQGGGVFRYGGPQIVPSPASYDLGNVAAGSNSTPATITIYNTGSTARAVSGKALSGTNASEFTLQSDTCTASLAASSSCTVAVVLTPGAVAGAKSAVLTITSDDPYTPAYQVALSGQATLGKPAGITVPANDANGEYQISWTSSPTNGVSYVLQEATNNTFTAGVRTAYTGSALSTEISGRSTNKKYYYRVKSVANGQTDSDWKTASRGCLVKFTAKLPGSITIAASDANGSYTVSWKASATGGVTYTLEEATDYTFSTEKRTAYSGTATSADITGRTQGKTYYYRVKATKTGYTNSAWRNGAKGCAIPGTSAVAAPTALTFSAVIAHGYTVNWGASTTPGVSYVLEEATNSAFSTGRRTAYTGTGTSVDITGRTAGKTYYYRVRALKAGSKDSAWLKGNTQAT